jgi:hypothetical protein
MRLPSRLIPFGLVLLATFGPAQSTVVLLAQNTWWESYRDGLNAWEAKQLDVAERNLKDALAKNPEQGRNVRVPGRYIVYLPEYYLGLLYAKQGRYQEALVLLQNVERAGLVDERHREYQALQSAIDEIRSGNKEVFRARTVKVDSVLADGTPEAGSWIIESTGKRGVYIVTALHVVMVMDDRGVPRAPKSIKVSFHGGQGRPLAGPAEGEWLDRFDVALDLVAIRVTKLPSGRAPNTSAWEYRQAPLQKQERVFTVGHAVEDHSVGDNVVLNPASQDSRRFLVSTAGIGQGHSGGPVIDSRGYLTGMMLKLTAGSGSMEAVKVAEILRRVQPWIDASDK